MKKVLWYIIPAIVVIGGYFLYKRYKNKIESDQTPSQAQKVEEAKKIVSQTKQNLEEKRKTQLSRDNVASLSPR